MRFVVRASRLLLHKPRSDEGKTGGELATDGNQICTDDDGGRLLQRPQRGILPGMGKKKQSEGNKGTKPAPSTGKPSSLIDTRVIYCGDNLEQLARLPPQCIDLIYIDPPFNSNRNYEVFWGETKEKRAFEDRHASTQAYIDYMRPRCVELARVLKKTGSFYYHCDWHASHYVKVMLDQILGENNFINEIVWKRQTSHNDAKQGSKHFGRLHDVLLFYCAGCDDYTWNQQYVPLDASYVESHYSQVDDSGRRFQWGDLRAPGGAAPSKGNPHYKLLGVEGYWRFSEERMMQMVADGRVAIPPKGTTPRYKRYLDESKGLPVGSVWDDINPINSQAKESLGYPTQKPFTTFSLRESVTKGSYELVRSNGAPVHDTLSDGERTFLTTLYFYHRIAGSETPSDTKTNRVIVFDDPVSSLDSDVLFVISSLIKNIFALARDKTSHVKQVFVLTHNVYFHKEITFDSNRQADKPRPDESFWIVRRRGNESSFEWCATNPVKSSYELLWAEVRSPNPNSLTICNALRRILENYFKLLGGQNLHALYKNFDGEEKTICRSLVSWINDGSHFAMEDLHLSQSDDVIPKYLDVFRKIFETQNHEAHYRMMMGDAFVERPKVEPPSVPSS